MRKLINVVIEGIDGSGKSTLANLIREELSKHFVTSITIPWFKDAKFRELAHIFNNSGQMTPDILATLHAAYTLSALEKFRSSTAYIGVIWDRYMYSSYCSTIIRGTDSELARTLLEFFPQMEITVYLNSCPNVCFERINSRGGVQFYESGLDRLYSGHVRNHGFNDFKKGMFSQNLIRECFIDTMSQWNKLIVEVLPNNAIVIDDYDMNRDVNVSQDITKQVLSLLEG